MADARPLSEHFAEKAGSDLELAQDMAVRGMAGPLEGSRKPGLALGTGMYLAQQALEKCLKSVVLQLDEIMGSSRKGDGGAHDALLRSLSHPIYYGMSKYYFGQLGPLHESGTVPGCKYVDTLDSSIAGDRERQDANLAHMRNFWDMYSNDREWQSITWRHSVGMCLKGSELEKLEPKHGTCVESLANSSCRPGLGMEHFSLDGFFLKVPPREALDAGAIGRRRAEHARCSQVSALSATLGREFRECRIGVRALARNSPVRGAPYIRTVRRALLEFGFALLLYHFKPYMALFPHSTMGRYPQILDGDGGETASLYGKQADYVLYYLLVDAPHRIGQLSDYSGRMASLWREVVGSTQ